MQVLKMFRQNVIKKILINIFTMPKFFYTYKSMEFYFLEEGTSVDAFKLSSGMFSQKTFRKECAYLSRNETRHLFSWKVD